MRSQAELGNEEVSPLWSDPLAADLPSVGLTPERLRALAVCLIGMLSAYPQRNAARDDERTPSRRV